MHRATSLRCIAILMLLVGLQPPAHAQLELVGKRLENRVTHVNLLFTATCPVPPGVLDTSQIAVFEEGIRMHPISLEQPDVNGRSPVSVALVFDASAFMIGAGERAVRAVGLCVIDSMDGTRDEAAILSYNQLPVTWQQMTTDTALLRHAMDSITSSGATALWDALYLACTEIHERAGTRTRAILVVCGAEDQTSLKQPLDVYDLVRIWKIPVHAVYIGDGDGPQYLRNIALGSGGGYDIVHEPDSIVHVIDSIMAVLQTSIHDYVVRYTPICQDGTFRTVELQLAACSDFDTLIYAYRPPRDSSSYTSMRLGLPIRIVSDTNVTFPVEVLPPFAPRLCQPFTLELRYDTSRAILRDITTAGTLLAGADVQIRHVPDGAIIELSAPVIFDGPGRLFDLHMHLPRHATSDTVRTRIWIERMNFETGCLIPELGVGELQRVADWRATCTVTMPALITDHSMQTYEPMPIPITADVSNIGMEALEELDVRLTVSGDMRILDADSLVSVRAVAPPALLSGGVLHPQWLVRVPPASFTRRPQIDVAVLHRGQELTRCVYTAMIPPVRLPLVARITPSGNRRICEGAELLLDAGSGHVSQNWSTGDTTRSIMVRHSGAYTVTITDDIGRTATSDTVFVTTVPIPAPRITVQGTLQFCEGDSVRLDAGAGWHAYEWNSGSTQRVLTVRQAGDWWVRVRTPEGCAGMSDTVRTEVLPLPPLPVIVRTDNTLSTQQPALTYQWYRNGVPIPDAMTRSHVVTQPGIYVVRVTNTYGCERTSTSFDVVTAVDAPVAVTRIPLLEAWPDPARDMVMLRVSGMDGERPVLRIVDVLGRTVVMHPDVVHDSPMTVSLEGLAPGPHLIIVTSPAGTLVHSFMKR